MTRLVLLKSTTDNRWRDVSPRPSACKFTHYNTPADPLYKRMHLTGSGQLVSRPSRQIQLHCRNP